MVNIVVLFGGESHLVSAIQYRASSIEYRVSGVLKEMYRRFGITSTRNGGLYGLLDYGRWGSKGIES